MATVPSPRVWSVGDALTAARLNTEISTALNWFFAGVMPKVKAYDNTGIVCADSTDVLLTLSGESYDTDSMHSTSTNTSRIVFNTAGYYRILATVAWPSATYTVSNIQFRLNSAENIAGGTQVRLQNYNTVRVIVSEFTQFFNAGDYIQAWIQQASGASRTTTSTSQHSTFIEATWVA